jgi:hypothetical protein
MGEGCPSLACEERTKPTRGRLSLPASEAAARACAELRINSRRPILLKVCLRFSKACGEVRALYGPLPIVAPRKPPPLHAAIPFPLAWSGTANTRRARHAVKMAVIGEWKGSGQGQQAFPPSGGDDGSRDLHHPWVQITLWHTPGQLIRLGSPADAIDGFPGLRGLPNRGPETGLAAPGTRSNLPAWGCRSVPSWSVSCYYLARTLSQ